MATATQYTSPPPYIQDLLTREGTGLFPQLSSSLNAQYQSYNQPRVAGFSQDQLDAFNLARQSVGATGAQEEAAGGLLGGAREALMSGGNEARTLLGRSVGESIPWLEQALSQAGQTAGGGLMSNAVNLLRQSTEGVTPGSLDQYMNPFSKNVIQATMDELNRQDAISRNERNAGAVASGAFGGSRQGVMEAEAARNLADVKARTLAQLNSQNFGQALQSLMQQRGRQAQAGSQLGGFGQNAIQQLMSGGATLSDILSGAAGTSAGLAGQRAAGLSDLAAKQLGLGSFIREQDISDISNLANIGQQQQAHRQMGLDVGYEDWLKQQAYNDPRAKVAFMSDIIGGAPSGSQTMSTQYTPPMSPLQAMTGIAPLALAFL